MIKQIVLDMGNVLIEWNPEKILAYASEDVARRQQLEHAIFTSGIWQQIDQGLLTIEASKEQVMAQLDASYQAAVEWVMYHWYEKMDVYLDTQKLAIELAQQGYGIYILSNTSALFHELVQQDYLPVTQVTRGIYLSYQTQLLKPDVAIYRDFCEQFQLNPKECVFIDDIAINIEAAKQIGMAGIVAQGTASIRRGLQQLGVTLAANEGECVDGHN